MSHLVTGFPVLQVALIICHSDKSICKYHFNYIHNIFYYFKKADESVVVASLTTVTSRIAIRNTV